MNINVLIDNHLPVELDEYSLKELNADHLREVIDAIKPKRLTAFAYGHDGWAQYPSRLNPAPKGMPVDLPQLWKDIAGEFNCQFGLYVSTLVNHRLLKTQPDWERIGLDGIPTHRIDHASPYFDEWLRPVLEELQDRYAPQGYFFDGDYWTVGESLGTWRARAAASLYPDMDERGLAGLSPEQHRQLTIETYESYIGQLGTFLAPRAPKSSVNLAFTLRHPAKRPMGLDLITSDLPPFFAAIDCWIETAVLHDKGAEREVVVPLFVEPEGGGRKYTKPLPQLVHETVPILALNESLHVYFPMDVSGRLRAGYTSLLMSLRDEIQSVAPCLNTEGYSFCPDVYCLSDSQTLLHSQNFTNLRGAFVAASMAGLNACIASTDICLQNFDKMRLMLAPVDVSPSAQACIAVAQAQGVTVLQRDFSSLNYDIHQTDLSELIQAYHSGVMSWWTGFVIERPAGAFVRSFRSDDGRWRIFIFNAVETGPALGRHVLSGGAGHVGRVTITCPEGTRISHVEGYTSSILQSEKTISFSLDGAFAVIEGIYAD